MDDAALSGSWHKFVLAVHVSASVGVLGADLVLLALGLAGLGGAAPVTVYPAARLVGVSVIAPLAVAALATGLLLALSRQWGLFRYWWVAIKLVITLGLTIAVLFVLLPGLEATAETATTSAAALGTRERVLLVVAPAVASSLLVVAATLGIFKPRWRLLSRSKPEHAERPRGIGFPRLYDLLITILTRGHERQFRERSVELAGVAPGDDVLDVGCGTGTQAVAAWRRCQPGGSVMGLDVSESMLAAARRKTHRAVAEVSFRAADASRLPFEDGCFDVVMASTVLHMIPEGRRTHCLEEAFRVLRRGGRLLLVDYAGDSKKRRHWSAKLGRHGRFDLERVRTPLVEVGFHDVAGGPLDWMSLHFLRAVRG